MRCTVAVLLAALLWQVGCTTCTDTHDDCQPGMLFDINPGYILSVPAKMTQVKHRSTKVPNKMDCTLTCTSTPWCRSINFKLTPEKDGLHICELIGTDKYTNPEYLKQDNRFTYLNQRKSPCEENPCLNDGQCVPHTNKVDYHCKCKKGYKGKNCEDVSRRSCADIHKLGERRNGVYHAVPDNQRTIQVYCDMISEGGGWTLIGRFSNSDTKNWMRDDGSWWYDVITAKGDVTSTSVNQDMISPAFWSVNGSEIKITRSDDPNHTALLRTTSNCLGSRTFRSMITSYGDFRNGTVWASEKCLGSCRVVYGGQYSSTVGFSQAKCSSNIQSSDRIGFWCNWAYDGAVMMIGGGGRACARADHGIGITEEDQPRFVTSTVECDFEDILEQQGSGSCSSSYALNLWIR